MKRPLYVVDAFTDKPLAGNAAAVVLDGADLESKDMQRIAAQMRHSETAFPLPARDPTTAFHLRWFTPVSEVAFCGHATLATLHAMVEEAKRLRAPSQLAFTCKAGRLRVELGRDEFKRLRILIETPAATFQQLTLDPELLAVLGLVPEALDPNLLPQRALGGNANLHLGLRERSMLAKARPDFKALAAYCRAHKLAGVCLYVATPEKGFDAALRYFAPAEGVDEDPVTGSACGQLGVLLQLKLPEEMPRKLLFSQNTGRVELEIRPEATPGDIRAWIGGAAVTVVRGELDLRSSR